jgi:carbon-monoxide dehydrogenase small subunit
MVQVSMSVNGELVVANVQPRTQLAEFLRDDLCLTGTHLGCEQGVCGACTVMVNGKMQRSCITFAADCDGANITTIEGFDDDPTMNELREAFSECHGLQCGFCTPGMLTTARDIILRLGEIPESRIREELSGNICRCTGYVGIVEAVKKVAAGKVPNAAAAVAAVTAKTFDAQMAAVESVSPRRHVASKSLTDPAAPSSRQIDGGVSIEERIRVRATPERVWEVLSDLRRVVPCVPGAEIATLEGENLTGKVKIALGPIKASFSGQATIGMEDARREGWMVGKGRDSGLGSSAEGTARWRVVDGDDNDSVVAVVLTWKLSGALAQFNRAGLVQDIVRRLAATFAANLEATITGSTPSVNPGAALGGFGLIWAVIKSRFLQRSNRSESQD